MLNIKEGSQNLFKNLVMFAPKNKILLFILYLFEISQIILMCDAIFKVPYLNFYFPFYFLNPLFYFELLNNLTDNTAGTICTNENIDTNQFYLMMSKFSFVSGRYSNCNYSTVLLLVVYGLILLSFVFLLLGFIDLKDQKKNKTLYSLYTIFMFFFSFFIYLCLRTLLFLILVVLLNTLIVTEAKLSLLDSNTILNFIVLVLTVVVAFIYNFYFIRCYHEDTLVYENDTLMFREGVMILFKLSLAFLMNYNKLGNDAIIVSRKNFIDLVAYLVFFVLAVEETKNFIREYTINYFSMFILYFQNFWFSVAFTKAIVYAVNTFSSNYSIPEVLTPVYFVEVITTVILTLLISLAVTYFSSDHKEYLQLNLIKDFEPILDILIKESYIYFKQVIDVKDSDVKTEKEKTGKDNFLNLIRSMIALHYLKCERQNLDCIICLFSQECFIYDKVDTKTSSKETVTNLFNLLLKLVDFWNDELQVTRTTKQKLIILKVFLYYALDEKISRIDYFMSKHNSRRSLSNFSYDFYLVFTYMKDKVNQFIMSREVDSGKAFILDNIKLSKIFAKITHNLLNISQNMKNMNKRTKIKTIDDYIDEFGILYSNMMSHLKIFKSTIKIKDPHTYTRFIWAFNFIFNQDFDEEVINALDVNDLVNILDESYKKDNYLLLKQGQAGSLVIKRVPQVFSKLYKYDKSDLIDKNIVNLFPSQFRVQNQQRISNFFLDKVDNTQSQNFTLVDKEEYFHSVDLIFNTLPSLYNKVYVLCYLKKANEERIIIDDGGRIFHVSHFFKDYLGITFEHIQKLRSKMFIQTILMSSLKNLLRSEGEVVSFTIPIDKYYEMYSNNMVMEGKQQNFVRKMTNQGDLKIKKKDSMKSINTQSSEVTRETSDGKHGKHSSNNIHMKFKLIQESTFDFFNANRFFLFSIIATVKNPNKKFPFLAPDKTDQDISDFLNAVTLDEKEEVENPKEMSIVSSASVSGYKDIIMQNGSKYNKKLDSQLTQKNFILSFLIIFVNIALIILGILLLIVINAKSAYIRNIYSVLKKSSILNAHYLNSITHITNMCILGDYPRDYKIRNINYKNITINLEQYFQTDFQYVVGNFTDNLKQITSDFQNNIDIDFYNNDINMRIGFKDLNGDSEYGAFYTMLVYAINTEYIISNYPQYFTQIPIFDLDVSKSQEEFKRLDTQQSNIVKVIINYREISNQFKDINQKMENYFADNFQIFSFYIYIMFFVFIFSHVLLFILNLYDIKVFYRKINVLLDDICDKTNKELEDFSTKIKSIDEIVQLEKKPSSILKKMGKSRQTKAVSKNVHNRARHLKKPNPDPDGENVDKTDNNCSDLKIFSKVLKTVYLLNLTYIFYSIISFSMISKYINDIKLVQSYNINLLELQRLSTNYFIYLKFALVYNDTVTPMDDQVLYSGPEQIYENLHNMIKLSKKNVVLDSIATFTDQLKDADICTILLKSESLENFNSLTSLCAQEDILSSSVENLFSFFVQKTREFYLSFYYSPKDKAAIPQVYNEKKYYILDFILIIFIRNFISVIRDDVGNAVYESTLNNLVNFSIIMFIVMIVTEFGLSIVNKKKVINILNLSFEYYVTLNKTFRNLTK